jgi:hypothetical protein
MIRTTVSLFCIAAVCCPLAFCSEIVIDEFTEPSAATYFSNKNSQVAWADSGLDTADTIGGVRDGSIGCEYYDNTSNVKTTVGGGEIKVDSTGNSTPSLYLAYDGHSGWGGTYPASLETEPFNGVFASTVDLTGGGTNASIAFRFTAVDGLDSGTGFNDFRITLIQGYTGDVNSSPGTVDFDVDGTPTAGTADYWYSYDAADVINGQLTNTTSEQIFLFDLASLVNDNNVTATFDSVQAIQIHACTEDTGLTYTLDSVRAVAGAAGGPTPVPEPATGWALASVALLAFRRRRR